MERKILYYNVKMKRMRMRERKEGMRKREGDN